MPFEWDPQKAESNLRKHGLSFVEAAELFAPDNDYLEIFDEQHSVEEDRFIAIGEITRGVVAVVYTVREEATIRIVSARRATAQESALFYEYIGFQDV